MANPSQADGLVQFGRINGVLGVRGWVKVFSYTRPREMIIDYSPWLIKVGAQWREVIVKEARVQGKGIVAKLTGVDDRDQASTLIGADIAIKASRLPPLKTGEYYWSQLIGLQVVNLAGEEFGKVSHLVETGANDVIVVQNGRERWLPVTAQVIREVDLAAGLIRVDWDADF